MGAFFNVRRYLVAVVVSHDGTRKGYGYSRERREPVLGSLDDAPQYGYVALAPGWFLFLQPAD